MAEVYVVNFSGHSREEITGGRVGHFVFLAQAAGPYHLGGDTVDDTNGVSLANNDPHTLYVTSPDEAYLYNESASAGSVRVFHNR